MLASLKAEQNASKGIKSDEQIIMDREEKDRKIKERMQKSGNNFDQRYKQNLVDHKHKELKN